MGAILNILVNFILAILKLVVTTVVAIFTAFVELFKTTIGEDNLASFKDGWTEAKDNVVLALAKEQEAVATRSHEVTSVDDGFRPIDAPEQVTA